MTSGAKAEPERQAAQHEAAEQPRDTNGQDDGEGYGQDDGEGYGEQDGDVV